MHCECVLNDRCFVRTIACYYVVRVAGLRSVCHSLQEEDAEIPRQKLEQTGPISEAVLAVWDSPALVRDDT